MASLHLTKSRTIAGLQCLRRLWLLVHEPPDYEEPGAGSPLAMGQEIGLHAHKLFPGGVLVAEEPWQHAQAVARTVALMADAAVPAVFEAAFVHDDIRIRVDVMERTPDGWGLREVKSSTRVKDQHLDDVALQRHVLAGAGVPVSSAEVLHVNNGYLRGAGDVDWPGFFTRCAHAFSRTARLWSSRAATAIRRMGASSRTVARRTSRLTGSPIYRASPWPAGRSWRRSASTRSQPSRPASHSRPSRPSSAMRQPAGSPTSRPAWRGCCTGSARRPATWTSRP